MAADSDDLMRQWQTTLEQYPPTATTDDASAAKPATVDLNAFRLLLLQGPDARSFLQGYLTCDVDQLQPDRALRGALTSLQGRVITDLLLLELNGDPAMIVHQSVVDAVRKHLGKYLMFAKSKLADATGRYLMLGQIHQDPVAGSLDGPIAVTPGDDGRLTLTEPGHRRRERLILPGAAAEDLWRSATRVPESAWRLADIEAGIARIRTPLSDEFLPQMLNLDQQAGISFSKGCYLGQEIVARAQHRGQVKRRLRCLRWQGDAATLTVGAKLQHQEGANRGILVDFATTGPNQGLGLAVLPVAAEEQQWIANGVTLSAG
jgi:tRNA-modifying protein YgfZ